MVKGFKPLYNNDSKILILGSLPGVSSINNNQYYFNASNHFWKILMGVYKEKIDLNNYDDKKEFLKKHRIALWDVIKRANREGSLDANIKNEEYNDIKGFIEKNSIKKIFVNGTKAEQSLKRYMKKNNVNYKYALLTSSSCVNTKYTLEEKINKWRIINT